MKQIVLNSHNYELIENDDCFVLEDIADRVTEYFDEFDYIFGDYAYEKVRLKGFYDSNNSKVKPINDIKNLDSYKKEYCSYGCRTFLLKKIS